MTSRNVFDAFGKVLDTPSPIDKTFGITKRGFTGHEHLEGTGLIHMNGRAYDPSAGRFLSVDPFIQSPENSQSFNPYSYVMNNPLSGVDPSGYVSAKITEIKPPPISPQNHFDFMSEREEKEIEKVMQLCKNGCNITEKDGNLIIQTSNGNSKQTADYASSVPGSASTSGKQLTSAPGGKTISAISGLEKSANKSLEELRKKTEFAELEKKYGALTLTFDNKKKTELDGNTININKSIFSIEYEVDVNASMDAYGGTLPDSMSNDAYYGAIDRYQQSLPEYNAFSMNRVIVHEAYHLMQKHVSGMEYTMNRGHYEAINIRRANQFMHKYYNEPFRDENHGKARSR